MKDIFADTAGWAHLLDSSQAHYAQAAAIFEQLRRAERRFVTTNYVLTELVALFNSPLRLPRAQIVQLVNGIKTSRFVEVVHIDAAMDEAAWQLLCGRLDKNWSLVDCSSFVLMQQLGLTEALTTDHHFTQAGFNALLSS